MDECEPATARQRHRGSLAGEQVLPGGRPEHRDLGVLADEDIAEQRPYTLRGMDLRLP